jgi:hypothetical protein
MAPVQQLATDKAVALLVVTHTRKPKGIGPDDPLDEVQNSTGLTAAADAVLVLQRPRYAKEATLFITGRDIEERQITLRWDPRYYLWSQVDLDNGPDTGLDPKRRSVREAIRKAGHALGPADLLKHLTIGPEAVRQLLYRMEKEELLIKEGYGRYNLPPQTEKNSSHCHTCPQGLAPKEVTTNGERDTVTGFHTLSHSPQDVAPEELTTNDEV